jgi:hypothetical protein
MTSYENTALSNRRTTLYEVMVSLPKDNHNREKYNTELLFHTSRVGAFICKATLHVIKAKRRVELTVT